MESNCDCFILDILTIKKHKITTFTKMKSFLRIKLVIASENVMNLFYSSFNSVVILNTHD